MGGLNNKFISSQFWRLKAQNQGASRISVLWELSPWFEDSYLLMVCLLYFLPACIGRKGASSLVFLLTRALIPSWGPHLHERIYNYLPKRATLNTITLEVRVWIHEKVFFWGWVGFRLGHGEHNLVHCSVPASWRT